MNNKYMAYGLIFLNVLLQFASCFWYRELPGFVWTLANAILILVPLVFGLKMGLLCLLPVAASELLWFFKLGSYGQLLHLASFTIAVILMAAAHRRLEAMPRRKKGSSERRPVYRRRRRGRTAVPGPAAAGSAETGAVGHFFR